MTDVFMKCTSDSLPLRREMSESLFDTCRTRPIASRRLMRSSFPWAGCAHTMTPIDARNAVLTIFSRAWLSTPQTGRERRPHKAPAARLTIVWKWSIPRRLSREKSEWVERKRRRKALRPAASLDSESSPCEFHLRLASSRAFLSCQSGMTVPSNERHSSP